MKIGELAKQTGLSIRTLHYYDEIGLLSPSHRTEIGHRLYGDEDIIRLQQIISLRQLGFSLKEIRECLENPDFSLPQVIDLHRARLQEQMALSSTLLDRLNGIARELKTTQSIAVETLIKAMENITMSEQYFTPDQQAVLEARFREGETDWQDFLRQVQIEMDNGSDLNSRSVRSLAKQWLWSMKSFIRGDEQLYWSIVKMYQQEGPKAASWGTMDTAMFEYILKAVSFLSLAEFTDLRIPTAQIFTPATRRVISLGQEAIRQIKLGVFGTEGMLLGLLADKTNLVAKVLNTAGVTFDVAQRLIVDELGDSINATPAHLESEVAQPDDQTMGTPQLPYAPRAKLVIELALEHAERLGQTDIAPEHLFLGILEEGQGVATHVLKERLKLDLEHLEQQLRLAMSA